MQPGTESGSGTGTDTGTGTGTGKKDENRNRNRGRDSDKYRDMYRYTRKAIKSGWKITFNVHMLIDDDQNIRKVFFLSKKEKKKSDYRPEH